MTKAERVHKAKVASMPCAICVRLFGNHEGGNVELHHLREGGWGKGTYETLIPLCFAHHRGSAGIHTMGTRAWARHFDTTQQELLAWTTRHLPA